MIIFTRASKNIEKLGGASKKAAAKRKISPDERDSGDKRYFNGYETVPFFWATPK